MTGLFGAAEKMKRVLIINYTTEFEHWKPSLVSRVEAKLEKPVTLGTAKPFPIFF